MQAGRPKPAFRFGARLWLLCSLLVSPTVQAAYYPQNQAVLDQGFDRDFTQAVTAYHSRDFAGASVQLERLALRVPGSFEVHELLGLSYAARGENAQAAEQLKVAVTLEPESAAARINLATALAHADNPKEAREQGREALRLAPQDYSANHNLAEFYLQGNMIAEALPLLEQAQRVRPDAYDNGYDLALAWLLTGKLQDAALLVEKLKTQKDAGELHTLLGRIDEKQGKFIQAANEFATAARMDPSEDNLFIWASELLLHRTYVPAIDVFKQAADRYPSSPRLLIGLGMALYSRGEYEASIRSLLKAADLNPTDSRCYLFLSKAYLSSPSQAQDVIGRFRRYAELEPSNALSQYYYAVSLWKGRRMEDPNVDYQTVEGLLKKSITLDGTIADAHLQLGILYNDQHEYAKALLEYERALKLNRELPNAHYRLGQYYVHAGDKARAQDEFNLFRKLQAEHQAEVDKERADVQQFVVSATTAPSAQP